MRASDFTPRKAHGELKSHVARRRAIEQAKLAGAVIGLFGGFASGVFGGALTAASLFVSNENTRRWLSSVGAILLYLTIPLLIIGGFCLDWLDKGSSRRDPKGIRYKDDDE